jgi:cellulose synthase/poly-beta-1,6-N-acetylglucosamine synthase-like glycosyltransferase
VKFVPPQHSSTLESARQNEKQACPDCSSHPFVSVIVCTVGLRSLLEECLSALTAQRCSSYEIIVVLNGEPNETFVTKIGAYPIRLFNERRLGVCIARNRGTAAAYGELLCFVDDDVVADPDWIHEMIRGFEDPKVACVTGRVRLEGALLSRQTLERSYESERALSEWILDTDEPNWYRTVLGPDVGFGCNMAFRKKFLQTQTLFPEAMGAGGIIGATDETFMFFQVLKHGLCIHHSPNAVVTHVYENDPLKQKNRMKEVFSAIVALHLKLLIEESGFRLATLKLLVRAFKRRLWRILRGEGIFRHRNEGLSVVERCGADLRGIWIYCKYRSRRNFSYRLSQKSAATTDL